MRSDQNSWGVRIRDRELNANRSDRPSFQIEGSVSASARGYKVCVNSRQQKYGVCKFTGILQFVKIYDQRGLLQLFEKYLISSRAAKNISKSISEHGKKSTKIME